MRAEITEALSPEYVHFDAINSKSDRALAETKNLNARISVVEQKNNEELERVSRFEKNVLGLQLDGPSVPQGV